MNKVYTIGRDPSCDIVVNDSSDVVSRVHATLKVQGGKYVLVDQSRNGTYVNGIRMSANEEVPVTRKDSISFAHVAELDWNLIPKDRRAAAIWIAAAAIAVIAAVAAAVYLMQTPVEPEPEPAPEPAVEAPAAPVVKTDTIRDTIVVKEAPRAEEKKGKKAKKEREAPEKKDEAPVIDALY